ncbi:MAG: ABC transporter substrate-binding protein [Gammaproteobacteria bacterium]|nr:ABC transporter substrate-binding protein [Gammaproteobacteria bacterium]MBU2435657.1 ABC transporter substrate-binding protein [Gammaproteobacteria bacterium]MBU2449562.1 ABC transporter substrate-binding protein [Gammaproteobacteria bacterium]
MTFRQIFARLAITGATLLPGVAAADIVIAQVAPFSGPLAPTGNNMKAGAQLCFDAVNAAGGINGEKIRLIATDDGYKTSETVRLVQEMTREHHPVAFFGIVGTGNVEGLIKGNILARAGIPLVAARTGATSVSTPVHPWLFLTRASYAQEIRKTVEQFVPLGYRRVAVFYQNDPFGLDGLKGLENALQQSGGELVAKGSYEKNTVQVENAVKTIAGASPQLVVMVSNTAASSEFVKQFRATGNHAQLSTISVTDGGQVIQKIGVDTARGLAISQVVPDPANMSVLLIREIQDRLKKYPQGNATLNHTLVEGYLGAKVLVEALRLAGPKPTAKKLRDTLEGIGQFDAGGLNIGFSPNNHRGSAYTDITIIGRNGKLLR